MISFKHTFEETRHKSIRPEGASTVSYCTNDILEILILMHDQSVSKFHSKAIA